LWQTCSESLRAEVYPRNGILCKEFAREEWNIALQVPFGMGLQ